ncbi:hypothetical protein E4P42_21440 [Mycobacterium sp. PS03-16]|uniref:hypothetical protein n=1 Tax=Mycobacterium sp. PS03-16 TaxID=2559611 RepID=UPI001072F8E4|nr:hypothetical protein [Mycobacterium sp. PS03-16]TFV55793.1 hypothetical protein E4P42_21440 [Mycobacterium sp. PS03-16]
MGERVSAPADATTEAIATTGLFLNFTAVIALAVCLASVGMSDALVATAAGIIAVLSFAASIVCFSAQARERQRQEAAAPQMAPAAS